MKATSREGLGRKVLATSTCALLAAGVLAAAPGMAATTERMYRQPLDANSAQTLTTQLQTGANTTLEPRNSVPTVRGTMAVRMQQMYKGVPVYGRSIVVEKDARGRSLLATGMLSQGLSADIGSITPKLSSTQALDILKSEVARSVAHLSRRYALHFPLHNGHAEHFVYPGPEGATARSVYLTSFVEYGATPSRPTAIIDADTGEIITRWDGLTMANATGPGGNTKTGQYFYGSGGRPYLNVTQSGSTCYMQNANVRTYNMNNATSGSGTLWSFNCASGSSGDAVNGAYSPINDAHHFGNVVHDLYDSWFGAPPLSFDLVMRVHYGNSFQNAFWDGSQMTFGDGASYFYPLVALDVTAHEISHGFTEQNSGLAYSGQSGGINEAFSDMAGEAAEYYDLGSNDWLVGVDITKGSDPLRWMCTPTLDGGSIDSANDYYSGLDVHYSSGVYNKAFCTLAQTSGWNTRKAFEAFVGANKLYWDASTAFDSGACGVQSAAADLGYSVDDVIAAFNAVDVDCPSDPGGGGTNPGGGALSNGVPVALSSVATGNFSGDYTVTIPAGASNLAISISGGNGDADLYVRFGAEPTTGSYDCRPYETGNNEDCTFASPSAGTYHAKVHAYQAFSNVTIEATWTTGGGGGGSGGSLDNGVPVALPSVGTGNFGGDYTVAIPSGASNLQIAISGGSGDADLYVRFGAEPTTSSYDCRPYEAGNSETCTFATPSAGTYHVKVRAYQAYANVQLVATWDTGGGGGAGYYDNPSNIDIPDGASASSSVNVSGEGSAGPTDLQVHVEVVHSYRGDLRITLFAPSGASVVLKEPDGGDGVNNVDMTWSVDTSSVNPNGTWTIQVDDVYSGDTGYIDDFSLTF